MKIAGTAALIGVAAVLGATILAQEGRKVTGVVEAARTRRLSSMRRSATRSPA